MPIQKVGQVFQVSSGYGKEHFFDLPSGIQQYDVLTMFVAQHGGGYSMTQANSGTNWTLLFDTNAWDWAGHTITCFQMVVPGIVPSKVKVWNDSSDAMVIVSITAHRNALTWDGTSVSTWWTYGLYHDPHNPWYCGGVPTNSPYSPPSPPVELTLTKPGVVLAFWAPTWINNTPTLSSGLTLDGWAAATRGAGSGGAVIAERAFAAPGSTGQMWASDSDQRYMAAAIPVYETNASPPQTDDRFTMDWKHGTKLDGATIPWRHYVAAAYHAGRKKHIIMGGFDEAWTPTKYGDTWEVDLEAGTLVQHTATSPGARYTHTMCYDSYRGKVMLWGDYSSDSSLWEYDTGWSSRSQAGSPPSGRSAAKYGARMCYDPVARRALFFGGMPYGGGGVDSAETWEINFEANPVTWTLITPPVSPFRRRFQAMCYNPKDGLIYMTGGCYGSNPIPTLSDTWTYNMATHQWTQITGDLPMQGRVLHGMYYDAAHDWIVVDGGYTGVGVYGGGTIASQECQILSANNWYSIPQSTSVAGPDGIHGHAGHGLSFDSDRQSVLISLGDWHDDSNNGVTWNHIAEGYFVRPEIQYVGYYARALYDPTPSVFPFDFRAVPGQSGDWIYMCGYYQKNGYGIGPISMSDPNYELIFSWDAGAGQNYNAGFRLWRGLWGNVSLTPTVTCPGGGYIRAAWVGSVYRNASPNILAKEMRWGTGGYFEGIKASDGFSLSNQKNALAIGLYAAAEGWGENGYSSQLWVPPGWSRPGVTGFGYMGMSAAVEDKYINWSPTNLNTGPFVLWHAGVINGIGCAILLEAAAVLPSVSTIKPADDPLFVIAQDVVRFKFTSELAVDSPYRSINSYKIENLSSNDACWIKEVLPVLGRTNAYLYISLGGVGFGNTYKFTVLDQTVHDNYGGAIEECSIIWTHHRTKVDSAISGLASVYDLRQRSNIRGMIEAMMIEDEIIGGDF